MEMKTSKADSAEAGAARNSDLPLVAVMMSTYNGERYLKPQIESILNQKNVKVDLYIRDDGSKDHTAAVLKEYKNRTNVHVRLARNAGVGRSFMSMVYDPDIKGDYYAFADQDDIWMEDKLERAVFMISEKAQVGLRYDPGLSDGKDPVKVPILYAGNQMLVDAAGNELGLRHKQPVPTDYHRVLATNLLSGCTMVWNMDLMNLLRDPKRQPPMDIFQTLIHDVWVAWVAALCGKTIFDMKAKIWYRQHEDNVVGAYKKTRREVFQDQIHKLKNKRIRNPRMTRARLAITYFADRLTEDKKDLYHYANYKDHFKSRVWLMWDRQTTTYTHENRAAYILKVILGLV
jgi:glycosyltransferase involved in cell wall biosynthesis